MSNRHEEMAERLITSWGAPPSELRRILTDALRAAMEEENKACEQIAAMYATGAAYAIRARRGT